MQAKLIVMDMDGTLLDKDKKIGSRTLEKLIEVQRKGCRLVLASGRVKTRLDEYSKQLQMDRYGGFLIEANGSCIYDYEKEERKIITQMTHQQADEIFQFIRTNYEHNEVMLMADVNAYVYLPDHRSESNYFNTNNMESLKNREIFQFNSVYDVKEMFFKVCTYDEPDKIISISERLKQHFKDKYWCGRTMPFWLEVVPINVSKGNALQKIMDKLHLKREEAYAFGDGENDISMLTLVNGVAMANAIESVKHSCAYETLSCDEEGIAHFLEGLKF